MVFLARTEHIFAEFGISCNFCRPTIYLKRYVKTIKYFVCQIQVSDGHNPDLSLSNDFFFVCPSQGRTAFCVCEGEWCWRRGWVVVKISSIRFIFRLCIDWCQGFGALWHIIFFYPGWSKERENCQYFFSHGTMNTKHILKLKCVQFRRRCVWNVSCGANMWNCLKREREMQCQAEARIWDERHTSNEPAAAAAAATAVKEEKYQIYMEYIG